MLQFFPFNLFKKKGNKTNELKDWQQSEFFQDIVNDTPVAIYTSDSSGRITYYNKAAAELLGKEPEINKDYWSDLVNLFYLDGRPMPLDVCPMARTLKEGLAFKNEELTLELADHSRKQLLVSSHPIFNKENNLIGAHNSLNDITEKIIIQEKQNILSAIVATSDDAIISKDINGMITSWNSGAQKIFGYTEQEALGKPITLLIPKERLQEEEIILGKIRNGEKINHYQTMRLHKSGKNIPISLTVSPLKDVNNKIIGASKIARDITELTVTQEMLKNYIDNLEILNSIGKLISEKLDVEVILQRVIDATTKITGASFGAFFYNIKEGNDEVMMLYNLSGASKEDFDSLVNSEFKALFTPKFASKEIIRIDDINIDPKYRTGNSDKPKSRIPVASYMSVPFIATQGEIIGGLLFAHPVPGVFTSEHEDIISSISSQSAVALENSKLFQEVKALSEKKDEFIALASHELKTPLTSIKGYLQLLEKKLEKDNNTIFIDRALNQVEKLDLLIADLLNVSKIEAGKLEFNKEKFEMNALLLEVIDIFSHSHQSHQIIFNNPPEFFYVNADKQRIEQVIINLISNAIKYSPKADKVYINLSESDIGICVKVKDEGIGLDECQIKNLFTKFYRTETVANVSGLGLGLYLSKEIIMRHNGEMNVTSELGKGSEFSFTLPIEK